MSAIAEKIQAYYEDPAHLSDLTEKQTLFIEGMRLYGTVLKACEHAHLSRQVVYVWRSIYPEFRANWDAAKEDANDKVKNSLFNMAVSEKNVVATIYWLKNNCPEYRDRVQVDVISTQNEVEDRLRELTERMKSMKSQPDSLPSASTKEIINQAIGLSSSKQLVDPRD